MEYALGTVHVLAPKARVLFPITLRGVSTKEYLHLNLHFCCRGPQSKVAGLFHPLRAHLAAHWPRPVSSGREKLQEGDGHFSPMAVEKSLAFPSTDPPSSLPTPPSP